MLVLPKNKIPQLKKIIKGKGGEFEPPNETHCGRLTLPRSDGGVDIYSFHSLSQKEYEIKYDGTINDSDISYSTPKTDHDLKDLLNTLSCAQF